jgi:hypothetical protein
MLQRHKAIIFFLGFIHITLAASSTARYLVDVCSMT